MVKEPIVFVIALVLVCIGGIVSRLTKTIIKNYIMHI